MSTDWLNIVLAGGWIGGVIYATLLALSLAAGYCICEQLLTVNRRRMTPAGLDEQVHELLRQGRVTEAEQLCRAHRSVLAFVLLSGLAEVDTGWSVIEKALEDSLAERTARLGRPTEYLSVIGNVAPLLGLLGTVIGILLVFRTIVASQATAGATELAAGFYLALVTTALGLIIAVPALGAAAFFRTRLDQLTADTAHAALYAIGPLKHRRMRIRGDFVVPPAAPPAVDGAP